jgi:pimeloyl-ACP methyl ester carboxylesterase
VASKPDMAYRDDNSGPSPLAGSPANERPLLPRKRAIRRWRLLVVPIGLVVLFYVVVGYVGSSEMIGDHPRWRGMNKGPQDFGLLGETVSFRSTDGILLKAWWLPAQGTSRATVIIAHGIDHTRQVMLKRAEFLVHGGYNVLSLDLRGHGESGGRVVSTGMLERLDLFGAIEYVRSREERGPIALLGVSYGAVACLMAAAESPEVGAVVSDGAFLSGIDVSDRINRYYAHDPGTNRLVRAIYAAGSLPGVARAIVLTYYLRTRVFPGWEFGSILPVASRVECPVLIVSGERDFVAPTANARRILDALPGDRKQMITIPNAMHDTTYDSNPVLYQEAVLSFLDGSFPVGTEASPPR